MGNGGKRAMSTAEFVQVRQAARELGVHENTLRRWEEAGLIRAVRLPSGVRRFRRDDVELLRRLIYESDAHGTAARAASRADAER
jgi:excisionase family DNA binding protein